MSKNHTRFLFTILCPVSLFKRKREENVLRIEHQVIIVCEQGQEGAERRGMPSCWSLCEATEPLQGEKQSMGACANLPDSQGLVPFNVISPEHSKTGQLRQAQCNLMDDLTMENWGEKEMTHARYQPRWSWKGAIPAIHLPSRKCLNEWALSEGANPSSLWGKGCPSILWLPYIVSRFGRELLGDFWQSIYAQFGTLP